MVARSKKSSSSSSVSAKDGGSHPQEKEATHRRFLVRSLERNDVDLAALAKVNASLHLCKKAVLEQCGGGGGEQILLDLGSGRLTLVKDELHEVRKGSANVNVNVNSNSNSNVSVNPATTGNVAAATTEKQEARATPVTPKKDRTGDNNKEPLSEEEVPQKDETALAIVGDPVDEPYTLTPAQKAVCVDFLARMTLRRKLANRLARRLNRVAQAMDGADVSAPPPPRYGDLRLHMDPAAVQAHKAIWDRQSQAKQAIAQAKQLEALTKSPSAVTVAVAVAVAVKEAPAIAPETTTTTSSSVAEETPVAAPVLSQAAETPKTEPEETPSTTATIACTTTVAADATIKTKEEDEEKETPAAVGTAEVQEKKTTEEEPTPMDVDSSTPPTVEAPASTTTTNPEPPIPVPVPTADNVPTVDTTDEPPSAAASAEAPKSSAPEVVESTDKEAVATVVAKPKEEVDDTTPPPSLANEYAILRQFDDAYQKVWDATTDSFQYVLTADNDNDSDSEDNSYTPDYQLIKAGAAIGAQARFFSEPEREQEFKRWQTSVLSRIPQQPTFADLGLKHRVFCMDARRKRCLQPPPPEEEEVDDGVQPASKKTKTSGSDDEAGSDASMEDDTEKGSPTKKGTGGKELRKSSDNEEEEDDDDDDDEEDEKKDEDDSSDMFDDEDEDDDEEGKAKTKDDEASKEDDDEAQAKEPKVEQKKITLAPRHKKKEEEDKEEDKTKEEVLPEPKRIKPMSLAAVPSFYEQDLLRIRTVHGDLLGTSILESGRRRMTEATQEYNNALRVSNQLYDHRTRIQQNLAYFVTKSRSDLSKVNSDHVVQVALAKQRWVKGKQEHDIKRVKQFMPSNWNRPPYGTNATQNYQRRGGVQSVIASTLADVVDGALILAEGKMQNQKYNAFVPPSPPHVNKQTGENLAQQHLRMEQELRRQINDCGTKFSQSEETRKHAWKKIMKTKAEVEPVSTSSSQGRRGKVDLSNYNQIPLPPLRNSTPQTIPHEFVSRAAVPSYTPPPPTTAVSGSASKSSASSKVQELVSADGVVVPVTEATKTDDGLYDRPPGRTRKGVKWDAVLGIWVSQTSQ